MGLLLGWMAFRGVDWGSIQSALSKVSWDVLVPALSAVILSLFLQAVRWKVLLPGEPVSTRRLFFVRNAGVSINNLTMIPGVLGEASTLAMLSKSDKIAGSKIIASIFVSRTLDFAATAAFLLVGFLLLPQLSVFRPAIVTVLVVAMIVMVIMLLAKRVGRLPLLRRIKCLQSPLHGIHLLRNRQRRLWLSLLLTVSSQMLLGAAGWLVAAALGIQLSFWMMSILLVGAGFFASVIPAGPAKLGTYEFTFVYVLGLFVVDRQAALTFALLTHALFVLPSMIIGILVVSRERKALEEVGTQAGGLLRRLLFRRKTPAEQPV